MFLKDEQYYKMQKHASKLSACKLNELINKCLDEKKFKDAQIYALFWNRKVGNRIVEKV